MLVHQRVSFAKPVLKFCECRACAWEYRYPNRCDSSLHSPLEAGFLTHPIASLYCVYKYIIIYNINAYSIHIIIYTRMYSQNWRAQTGFEIANSCLRHAWEQWHRCGIAELMPFCSILSCNIVQWKMMENVCFGQQICPTFDSSVQNHETGLTKYIQSLRLRWVCLKMGYTPNYGHLVGIMIINHWV